MQQGSRGRAGLGVLRTRRLGPRELTTTPEGADRRPEKKNSVYFIMKLINTQYKYKY